jgi:hypothetical protein
MPELPSDQFQAMGGLTFAGPNNCDYWVAEPEALLVVGPQRGLIALLDLKKTSTCTST